MSEQWARIYKATFGRELSEASTVDYAEEIRNGVPDVKRHEVIAAIRSIGRMGKTFGVVGAGEIIREIRALRDRALQSGERPEQVNRACPYCAGTGVIDRYWHIPELGAGECACTCRRPGGRGERVIAVLRRHGQDYHNTRYRANLEHAIASRGMHAATDAELRDFFGLRLPDADATSEVEPEMEACL
jgi:hypothetical protein